MELQLKRKTEMIQAIKRGLAAVGVLTFMGAASAAPVDVAAVVTDIGAQIDPITDIGGAVLLVFVAVAAFKWVRRALS